MTEGILEENMTPTQRTLKHLRDDGWLVAVVERFNPFAKIRVDLYGFVDIIGLKPGESTLFVQTTSGSNASARVKKIQGLDSYITAKQAGVRVEVHGWSKTGPRGKRKAWTCRVVEL